MTMSYLYKAYKKNYNHNRKMYLLWVVLLRSTVDVILFKILESFLADHLSVLGQFTYIVIRNSGGSGGGGSMPPKASEIWYFIGILNENFQIFPGGACAQISSSFTGFAPN